MPTPIVKTFVLGGYQTNCFVVSGSTDPGSECWIVDCGYDPDELLAYICNNKLIPKAILLTHAHSDHIAGVNLARKTFGDDLPIVIHEAEQSFLTEPMLNLSAMLGQPIEAPPADRLLHDGDELTLVETSWRVVHAPGHSPGSVLFIHDESKQAIVGDTLFAGSIGRFDFPTSNADDLRNTIKNILMSLPDEMQVYPGHGPATTIGQERKSNPFVLQGF